ncbi:MAG: hypothetical protein LBR27_01275 [Bifidobacteriaceae bacterium]|jgi:hypothetical protein|nr:hypothetical protein [Bifidobacteriaceae bacterium]
MPRKHRIVLGGLAALILAAGGATLGAAIKGRPITVTKDTDLAFDLPAPVRESLYYASLAPNSHNAQMWQVTAYPSRGELAIALDPDRLLPVTDPAGREALISVGAFTENLVQSLEAYGYEVEVTTTQVAEAGRDGPVVIVHYGGNPGEPDGIGQQALEAMTLRHTEKGVMLALPLTAAQLEALAAVPGVTYFQDGSDGFAYLAGGTVTAYRDQANDLAARQELAGWLRLSNGEALAQRDGLPAEQLGITGITKTLYYLTTSQADLTGDSFANQGISRTEKQVDGAAGFAVLVGDDPITAGRDLERLWLAATRAGVSVQPMSQILEDPAAAAALPAALGLTGTPQMILRVGRVSGDYGQNLGLRRPLAEFVTNGEP